jgi:hypothetical protein
MPRFVLGIIGMLLIGLGVVICTGWLTGGVVYVRFGATIIAFGIAILGYWALSNENKDYNF